MPNIFCSPIYTEMLAQSKCGEKNYTEQLYSVNSIYAF